MDVNDFLQLVQRRNDYRDQIAHVRKISSRSAKYEILDPPLGKSLTHCLALDGVENLYSHQVQAIQLARNGDNVLVVTGTASGKSLCYNLPVFESLIGSQNARAMYIYPTKALAQDQLAAINRWISYDQDISKTIKAAVYDGDTPSSARTKIRQSAKIILTNPDMLHQGILPYHTKWADFFRNLKFIIIDELHTYRGIFGSQFANVLRRFQRLLHFHGGSPQFICASATIGNPLQLAESLLNRKVSFVNQDGSPRGEKYFVLWNPSFVDASGIIRRSATIEAKRLFTELVRYGAQTITFTKARVAAELIYKYARKEFENLGELELIEKIRAYRGGYLPADRREIEKLLFTGKLRGVCTTNALELGIDVGSLDAAIIVGFPGTISSVWQQAGRAGRRSGESVAFLIGYNDPIDQYLMHNPDYFFSRNVEHAIIDPDNPRILAGHLACAAFELPLSAEDKNYFGSKFSEIMETITEGNDSFHQIADRYHWASSEFPASGVNLRTIGDSTYSIIDDSKSENNTIGSIDSISAPEQLYPSAVYIHEGQTYLVKELDSDRKIARVIAKDVDYYTQPILAATARITNKDDEMQSLPFGGKIGYGPLMVVWKTVGFKKIKFYTMENIGQEALDLPELSLPTRGFWFVPDESLIQSLSAAGYIPTQALVGLRNLMIWSLPLLSMCDPNDIAGQVNITHFASPAIIMYDRYLDGLGFARRGYENFNDLISLSHDILSKCSCEDGCPSCVGLPMLRPPIHHDPQFTTPPEIPDKNATAFLFEALGSI
jgi:DEAD/DEAH box helicase domain-containing protein